MLDLRCPRFIASRGICADKIPRTLLGATPKTPSRSRQAAEPCAGDRQKAAAKRGYRGMVPCLYGGSTSRPYIVTIYSERGGAGAVKAPKKKRLTGPVKTRAGRGTNS